MYVYAVFNNDGIAIGLGAVPDFQTVQRTLTLDFYKGKTTRALNGTRYENLRVVNQLPRLDELDAHITDDGLTPAPVPL
jgi:hypothetical protein